MAEYNFTLFFDLNKGDDPEDFLDRLFEAGCDDTLPLIGRIGSIGLVFGRESDSADAAVDSAISNVLKAIPHAKLVRAEPDLVNLTEMAELVGTTKQNIRRYAKGEAVTVSDPFPTPRVAGKTGYWHADELAHWLADKTELKVEPDVLKTLSCTRILNARIEISRHADAFSLDMGSKAFGFIPASNKQPLSQTRKS